MYRNAKTLITGLLLVSTAVFYQNCAKVGFNSGRGDNSSLVTVAPSTDETIVPQETDIPTSAPLALESSPGLGCSDVSAASTAARSQTLPNLAPSVFQDRLDNYGQDWRFSPPVQVSGKVEFWSTSANSGYRLNGQHNVLKWMGSNCNLYYASIDVKASDSLQVGSVSSVFGAKVNWIVVGVNSQLSVWKNSTHDYTLTNGHNAVAAAQGGTVNGVPQGFKCSGNLIKTMAGGNWAAQGACVDYSQSDLSVKCAEIGEALSGNSECRLFDGTAVKGGTDLSFHVLIFDPQFLK